MDSENAFKKTLLIREKESGMEHPQTAMALNNLGIVLEYQGKYKEAERTHIRALAIYEKKLGAEHRDTAMSLNSLGDTYRKLGKYLEAEEAQKRAIAIRRKKIGSDHPRTANCWSSLGKVYLDQERYSKAEIAFGRVLEIREIKLSPSHPTTAETKTNISLSLLGVATQDSINNALDYIRSASSTIYERSSELSANPVSSSIGEQKKYRWIHATHLKVLSQAQGISILNPEESASESFVVLQRSRNSAVARAIAKMAIRTASEEEGVEDIVLSQQKIIAELIISDKSLTQALSAENTKTADHHQKGVNRLKKGLIEINARLAKDYPEYAELSNPKPIALKEAQALLNVDEALLAIIVNKEQSYLWAVRNNKAEWWTLPVKKESIDAIVKSLRGAMDPNATTGPSNLPDFPVGKAQKLYKETIASAAKMLKGAKRVFVVADGSLQSIPFGIMVNGGKQQASYKDTNWLAKEYAFAYLPSVSSLKALRTLGNKNTAPDPFIGFGDPVLGNNRGELRVASVFDSRGTGLADIRGLRQLSSLPETADELNDLAITLGASSKSVYLQQNATEKKLKNMDLSNSRVLAFATHGLLAGDVEFLGEPALVLTPPNTATEEDDGLLTAGEVTQLKLNADWVVLSACNTASPDGTPGAEGFSGLTKAFFYAGAKTLLVSHWPVESNSAKQLTTSIFNNLRKNPTIGKAEALRQARLQMINDKQHPYLGHPIFWAPFVVVGEAKTTH